MRYIFYLLFGIFLLPAKAQDDTLHLEAIEVYGEPIHLFTTGTGIKNLELAGNEASLSEVLENEGNLYLKSYGHHQLATISFRGTGASHTSTLWHGIPVNYPTLGLMDFSQWPAWMLESVQLQPGSRSALYGSGAIGGTVLLDNEIDLRQEDHTLKARMDAGSFGYFSIGADARYGRQHFVGRTKILGSSIKNDFPYIYNEQEVRQVNAATRNVGFQQQLQYDVGNHRFTLDGMVTANDRENQPTKGSTANDHLNTTNIRAALTHSLGAAGYSLHTTMALIRFDGVFNEQDRTLSNQYSLVSSYYSELGKRANVRLGLNTNLFTAEADNYPNQFTDVQTAFFGSVTARPTHYWKTTLNLRQSIYMDNHPFTPSISQTFRVAGNEHYQLKVNQQLGLGFRFPTLNDLHWVPGGNPDLLPEKSTSGEVGISWEYLKEQYWADVGMNLFKTWSRDFIVWIPGEVFWAPENFQEVNITGMEAEGKAGIRLDPITLRLSAAYSFTKSLNETGTNSGNQLPYVPRHNASASLKAIFRTWDVRLMGNFTGLRYTTLSNDPYQSVNGFSLIHLTFNKEIRFRTFDLGLGGSVRNVLDKDYENLINRAMPGRNYQVHFLIEI